LRRVNAVFGVSNYGIIKRTITRAYTSVRKAACQSARRRHCRKKVNTDICIAPYSKELTAEALRCGSHNFYTANTPHLPLPVAFHQMVPLLCVVIAAI